MTNAARWGPRIAAVAVLALAAAAGRSASAEEKKEDFGRLTIEEVQAVITKGDGAIFDNNSKAQWAGGHVPTAKWVDYKKLAAEDLPQDKDKQLVFYCANEF